MRQDAYLNRFTRLAQQKIALTQRKNRDYAGPGDAFANFQLIEVLTQGRISTAAGILVRMTDKIQRIANLLARPAMVADESIIDSCLDLSVYSDILNLWLTREVPDEEFGVAPSIPQTTDADLPQQTGEEEYDRLMAKYDSKNPEALTPFEREKLKALIIAKIQNSGSTQGAE